MNIFKVRCDECGIEESRKRDEANPMLHLIIPGHVHTEHLDFCCTVCVAKWTAAKAVEEGGE